MSATVGLSVPLKVGDYVRWKKGRHRLRSYQLTEIGRIKNIVTEGLLVVDDYGGLANILVAWRHVTGFNRADDLERVSLEEVVLWELI